jgi:hypothetical protein
MGPVRVSGWKDGAEGTLNFCGAEGVALNGAARLHLSVAMKFRVRDRPRTLTDRRRWKVSTTGWIYVLKHRDGRSIGEFHWHPAITPEVQFPHVHVPSPILGKHFPTGRVLIEDILGFAVECGAEPYDPVKWEGIRSANVKNFELGATWGARHRPWPWARSQVADESAET